MKSPGRKFQDFFVALKGKNMRIENINNNLNFKGPLDGTVTKILRTCDMNEMVNAVGIDVGAMVIPRSYYDTVNRNEYAGGETFFREFSGTFINCLSAGIFAKGISKIASKQVMPDIKINPNCWYSQASLDTLKEIWDTNPRTEKFVENVLENLSGRDGKNINEFKNIQWDKIEWIDEEAWKKIKWKNQEYKDLPNRVKSKEGFVNSLTELINDKNLCATDKKNALSIIESRLTNALGAGRDTEVNINGKKLSAKLENILRDTHDLGKDVFKTNHIEKSLEKIAKINKIKAFGAISLSCILGITNQYINRKITEKRTGKKGFVGDVDFEDRTENKKECSPSFWLKKLGASALMIGMVLSTMKVKNFKDFAKRLEFTGPITSGNAIKTVYGSTIVGRFLAADNETELRESMTRDYLGFLNWLVFGGFAAKGVANLLDKKGKNLFNYTKEGKGIKHWLNNMNLKTHNEITAKGSKFAKENLWKLNVAQASGIAYSAITLGYLLPMLNAKITEKQSKKERIK